MLNESVALVAPVIFAPFLRHWNVGVGLPDATTVKLTLVPAVAVWVDAGWLTITGALEVLVGGGGGGAGGVTTSVTTSFVALLVTAPAAFVATAR